MKNSPSGTADPSRATFRDTTDYRPLEVSLEEISQAASGMLDRFNESEPHFVRIADSLETCATEISQIRAACNNLLAQQSAENCGKNQLLLGIELLVATIEVCQQSNMELSQALEKLRKLQRMAEGLGEKELELKTVIDPFSIILILFKIHSAQLPEEQRQIFVVLSTELEKLVDRTGLHFTQQFSQLHQVLSTLDALVPALERNHQLSGNHLGNLQRRLHETSEGLQQIMAQGVDQVRTLSEHSGELQRQVGQLVMGMQFHDITRQRLEHFCAAVQQMRALPARLSESGPAHHSASRGHYLNLCLLIQRRQISSIIEGISDSETNIRTGISGLIRTARILAREATGLLKMTAHNSALDDLTNNLMRLFEVLPVELARSGEMSARAHQAILPLHSMDSQGIGKADQIALEIKLISLNSQVQAVHLEEGMGLDVLSSQTCEISSRVLELNDQLGADVSEFLEHFTDVHGHLELSARKNADRSRQLGADAKATHGAMRSAREAQQQIIAGIADSERAVRSCGEAILNQLQFKDKLLTDAAELTPLFDQFSVILNPLVAGTNPLPEVQTWLSDLTALYTMSEERVIHDSIADGGKRIAATSPSPASTNETDFFDFSPTPYPVAGEIISEKVSPASPVAPGSPSVAPAAECVDTNIEMF